MEQPQYRTMEEMEAGLDFVCRAPRQTGTLELIVRRPHGDAREVLQEGQLSPQDGLVGDNWKRRGSMGAPVSPGQVERQITIMNSRLIDLLAGDRQRWALAGDQLFVDLDLSESNLPPGTRLAVGSAILEITAAPHSGCKKFAARFGLEALQLLSNPSHKGLRLRGIYARVVQAGIIHAGDQVQKLAS